MMHTKRTPHARAFHFLHPLRRLRLILTGAVILAILSVPFGGLAGETNWQRSSVWTVLPFDNPTVSLQSSPNNLIVNNNGRIEILLLGGMSPLVSSEIDILPAVINIVGQWSTSDGNRETVVTDCNGFASIELPPGDYALRLDEYFGRVFGLYGVNVKSDDYGGSSAGAETSDTSMITVSLHSGEIVAVMISLAHLTVGVTTSDGKTALPGKNVYVYPEDYDIAGNPIARSGYGNTGFQTTAAGTCEWFLAGGVYTIRVDNWPQDDTYIYGVQVSPGEVKQIIATGN